MKRLESYIGIEPFTVVVDDSQRLRELAEKARLLRELPFAEKLSATKRLVHEAISHNAYEMWIGEKNDDAGKIVTERYPLSVALNGEAGCCRYQGALFFVLGFEAQLGDAHFLQAAPVSDKFSTVFNQIYDGDMRHDISIFTESLKDKKFDYTASNPRFFEQVSKRFPGMTMYSYHKTREGLFLVSNGTEHPTRFNN